MPDVLYATCTNTSNILSVSFSDSHVAATSTATVTAISTSLEIGDSASVFIGYVGDNFKCITGFVKNIELSEPEKKYVITIANVLIRAVDFFIAAENPAVPFSRRNITAEDLIQDILELSGLTSFNMESTSFTFAINNPVEVNLTGAYDYAKFLANIIAYTLYADNNGVVHLINRRPYPVGAEPADYTITVAGDAIIESSYERSDHDIRNKIIVYGSEGISATASATSPYLPAGFYRTVVVAAPGVIDTQSMASQAASYNLDLLNRLTQKVNVIMKGQTNIFPRTIADVTVTDIGVSGTWYVYAVTHDWSKAGYTTTMELRK